MVVITKEDNLRQQIYKAVVLDIITGRYPPDAILNESALIKETGFSKSPVRDALIELCKDGILVNIPRFGYRVTQYTNRWFEQVKDFRICIELHYLEKNWSKVNQDLVDRLRHALEHEAPQDRPYTADAIEHWIRNQRFHLTLAKHWQDDYFYDMLETALSRQTIAYAQFYWQKWQTSTFPLDVAEHKNFIAALEARDLAKARTALLQDLQVFTPIAE